MCCREKVVRKYLHRIGVVPIDRWVIYKPFDTVKYTHYILLYRYTCISVLYSYKCMYMYLYCSV